MSILTVSRGGQSDSGDSYRKHTKARAPRRSIKADRAVTAAKRFNVRLSSYQPQAIYNALEKAGIHWDKVNCQWHCGECL